MYADIPSKTLPGGGTVPPHLLVTAQKPDLVIIDRMEEKMDIFELTVPLETNIKNANTQKMNKYEHFITDITTIGMCLVTLLKSAQENISHHQIKQILRNCIIVLQTQCWFQSNVRKSIKPCSACHHTTFLENEKR